MIDREAGAFSAEKDFVSSVYAQTSHAGLAIAFVAIIQHRIISASARNKEFIIGWTRIIWQQVKTLIE
ncbi:MAG: hypothetical protein GY761_13735 [Hyphomicrobiales bacterium]|nr:hypothetical protein [Hyphomicrobiales bacterium]